MSLSLPQKRTNYYVYKYYKYEIDAVTKKLKLISPFRRTATNFAIGDIITSTRTKVGLTATERRTNTVNDGLHVFLVKEDAITNAKSTYEKTVVVRLVGNGSDLVSLGYFGGYPNAVYTKLKINSVIGFYTGPKKQRSPKWK